MSDKDEISLSAIDVETASTSSPDDTIRCTYSTQVRRRLRALKKILLDLGKMEEDYFEEFQALEKRYDDIYRPIYDKRKEIITGQYEPTDEECEFPEEIDEQVGVDSPPPVPDGTLETGVPNFWLIVLKNAILTRETITKADEAILLHLSDLSSTVISNEEKGFRLDFKFEPNQYFTNRVLSKTYILRLKSTEQDMLEFEGPTLIKCMGCNIDWLPGQDVTVKKVIKKQRNKMTGEIKTREETVETASFFNFFKPIEISIEDEMDEPARISLSNHFELGHYFIERVIPKAVLYYTGDIQEDVYIKSDPFL